MKTSQNHWLFQSKMEGKTGKPRIEEHGTSSSHSICYHMTKSGAWYQKCPSMQMWKENESNYPLVITPSEPMWAASTGAKHAVRRAKHSWHPVPSSGQMWYFMDQKRVNAQLGYCQTSLHPKWKKRWTGHSYLGFAWIVSCWCGCLVGNGAKVMDVVKWRAAWLFSWVNCSQWEMEFTKVIVINVTGTLAHGLIKWELLW